MADLGAELRDPRLDLVLGQEDLADVRRLIDHRPHAAGLPLSPGLDRRAARRRRRRPERARGVARGTAGTVAAAIGAAVALGATRRPDRPRRSTVGRSLAGPAAIGGAPISTTWSARPRRPRSGTTWPGVPDSDCGEAEAAVLEHHRPEVAGVEQLDPDVRVQLAEPPELAVLLADEALLERRHLEEDLEVGQVEVRREALDDLALEVPEDREGRRLVLPADRVEVQDPGHLGLAGVGEAGGVDGARGGARQAVGLGGSASAARRVAVPSSRWPRRSCRLLGSRPSPARFGAAAVVPRRSPLRSPRQDARSWCMSRTSSEVIGRRVGALGPAPSPAGRPRRTRGSCSGTRRSRAGGRPARRARRGGGPVRRGRARRRRCSEARPGARGGGPADPSSGECTRSAPSIAPGRIALSPIPPGGIIARDDQPRDSPRTPAADRDGADHFRHSYTRDKAAARPPARADRGPGPRASPA